MKDFQKMQLLTATFLVGASAARVQLGWVGGVIVTLLLSCYKYDTKKEEDHNDKS